jgi:hypothetical protein
MSSSSALVVAVHDCPPAMARTSTVSLVAVLMLAQSSRPTGAPQLARRVLRLSACVAQLVIVRKPGTTEPPRMVEMQVYLGLSLEVTVVDAEEVALEVCDADPVEVPDDVPDMVAEVVTVDVPELVPDVVTVADSVELALADTELVIVELGEEIVH